MNRPVGIDPTKGVGTAYEGMVKVPRPGGIRKGWIEQFVVVCDFKIFLFDITPGRGSQPSHSPNQVLDIRFTRLHSGLSSASVLAPLHGFVLFQGQQILGQHCQRE